MPIVGGAATNIGTSQIADGSILNADINAGAAIALSKLAVDPLARANHTGSQLAATLSDLATAILARSQHTGTQLASTISDLATSILARSQHTGTQLSSTISDFSAAVLALVSPSIPEQDIRILVSSSTALAPTLIMGTNTAGNVMVVAYHNSGTSIVLFRLQKDSSIGQWRVTHTTTLAVSATSTCNGLAFIGSNVFLSYSSAGSTKINRWAHADLSGTQDITISGTARRGPMFSDNVDLYICYSAGTVARFTVSGTTATNANDSITFTGMINTIGASIACDATNVFQATGSSGNIAIKKWPLAGGAATSTSSTIFEYPDALPNSGGLNLGIVASGVLGIAWGHTNESNAAVLSTSFKLTAVPTT